jgi:hypothetical protein
VHSIDFHERGRREVWARSELGGNRMHESKHVCKGVCVRGRVERKLRVELEK